MFVCSYQDLDLESDDFRDGDPRAMLFQVARIKGLIRYQLTEFRLATFGWVSEDIGTKASRQSQGLHLCLRDIIRLPIDRKSRSQEAQVAGGRLLGTSKPGFARPLCRRLYCYCMLVPGLTNETRHERAYLPIPCVAAKLLLENEFGIYNFRFANGKSTNDK